MAGPEGTGLERAGVRSETENGGKYDPQRSPTRSRSLERPSGTPLADRFRRRGRDPDRPGPGADAEFVSSLSALIVLMALVYVGAAALGWRRASWILLLTALPVAFFLPRTSWVNPLVVLLSAAAAFLVLGALRGQRLRKPGGLGLQATGFFVFGAIGLMALYVAPGT